MWFLLSQPEWFAYCALPVLSKHLSGILFHFISYISNYQGNPVIAIFTPFLFLCSICQWNLISAVLCHRLIVWNKLHLRLLHRKNGERLYKRKLEATAHYQIDSISETQIVLKYQPKLWKAEKSWPLKIDSFGSGAKLNCGTYLHITELRFCLRKNRTCSDLSLFCL